MPQAMKGSLLARRPDPSDAGPLHRWIEDGAQHRRRVEMPRRAREDERALGGMAELGPPPAERLDEIRREVDGAVLAVLRRREAPAGVAAADAHDRFERVHVRPCEREQLADPHPGLDRD